jgi:hypothetical protein
MDNTTLLSIGIISNWLVEEVKSESKSTKRKGERVESFQNLVRDYLFYHYMQVRDGGLHGKLLKLRV